MEAIWQFCKTICVCKEQMEKKKKESRAISFVFWHGHVRELKNSPFGFQHPAICICCKVTQNTQHQNLHVIQVFLYRHWLPLPYLGKSLPLQLKLLRLTLIGINIKALMFRMLSVHIAVKRLCASHCQCLWKNKENW